MCVRERNKKQNNIQNSKKGMAVPWLPGAVLPTYIPKLSCKEKKNPKLDINNVHRFFFTC